MEWTQSGRLSELESEVETAGQTNDGCVCVCIGNETTTTTTTNRSKHEHIYGKQEFGAGQPTTGRSLREREKRRVEEKKQKQNNLSCTNRGFSFSSELEVFEHNRRLIGRVLINFGKKERLAVLLLWYLLASWWWR